MRRLLAAAAITATLVLAPLTPAAATSLIPGQDCTADVPIGAPQSGPAGSIDSGPMAPNFEGDPFADPPTSTVYETYGYGGVNWINYDLGCAADASGGASNPEASGLGMLANVNLDGLTVGVAITTAVTRFAFNPDTLDVFEPVQRLGADAFGENVFLPLIVVAMALLGLWLMIRARYGNVRESAGSALWSVFVVALALLALLHPTTLAPAVDNAATGIVGSVNSAVAGTTDTATDSGDAVGGNLHRAVLYETWAAGNFGRYGGETAAEYGPQLFAASTLSRAEAATIAEDPEAGAALIEDKQQRFKEVAEQIKNADPAAYEYLAGHKNGHRFGYTLLGVVALLVSGGFLIIAGLLMIYALLVLRLAIMAIPITALVAIFRRDLLIGMLDYVAGALLSAVAFGSLAAVFVAATGAFLSPTAGIPAVVAWMLLLAMTVAAWVLSKPFRAVRGLSAVMPHLRRRTTGPLPKTDGDQRRTVHDQQRDGEQMFTPTAPPSTYRIHTPLEATKTTVRAATAGAVQGAVASVVAGALTGGTATVAAIGAGATKGAVVAGTGQAAREITHSETAAGLAQRAVAGELTTGRGRHAAPTPTSPTEATTGTRPTAPAPADPPMRVYTPGEALPTKPTRIEPSTDGSYDLYTPAATPATAKGGTP